MSAPFHTSLKKYPFARLLAALITGIIIEWYLQFSLSILITFIFLISTALFCFTFFSLTKKFTFRWVHGMLILLTVLTSGSILTYLADVRHRADWFGNYQQSCSYFAISLKEAPEQKTKSFKAIATVDAVLNNNKWQKTSGKILVYFEKENLSVHIQYGSQIVFKKPLQAITNTGNPGAFDYNRYCLFQNITAQVYLKNNEYKVLTGSNKNMLAELLIKARNKTLEILKKNIKGGKEAGVAEALLIGYRIDLDKDLVQAYSNTGVVHIIAISGLHLGMIYGLLAGFFSIFKRWRWTIFIKPVVILLVLWLFTLVAGAAPSILRSAVMFTFIVIAEMINRKTNMYNTLAASAFCMLVINPYTLWDVGFLLSYAAVISIVSFMMPVYRLLYFKNKLPDKLWSLTSVTISAQVLTVPIVIFYFHQFPNLFLVTNLLVVPLSAIILYGEILLLFATPFSIAAQWLGNILNILIGWMNQFIEQINVLPFAVWGNLQLSIFQTWLFYGITVSLCAWLMKRYRKAFLFALVLLAILVVSISTDLILRNKQQQLIVYNVPKMSAIDLVQGKYFHFTGDTILETEDALKNFYLKPSRVSNQTTHISEGNYPFPANKIINIGDQRILLIDNNFTFSSNEKRQKIAVDIIIISGNPTFRASQLTDRLNVKQLIFDSSNPLWKIQLWKKDCDSLHLRFHSTAGNGAFVMDI